MGKRMVCLLLCLLCVLLLPGCTKQEQAEMVNETTAEAAPEPEAPAAEAAAGQEEGQSAEPLPFLLGCSAEEAEKALAARGYTAEAFPETVEAETVQNAWFSWFGVNLPQKSRFVLFVNGEKSISHVLAAFREGRLIAYSGQLTDLKIETMDALLQTLQIQTLGEPKYAEPQVLNWNGTDMDGKSYDWQTHERIEYEFADFNLQLCGLYGENDAQKQRLIPVSFAFVSAEAAIIEGHIESSPIFQREAAAEDTSGFEPCPFTPSAAGSAIMREDWYDNGVFSSFTAAAYPGYAWNYAGTILDITGDNPYDYAGYDLYCLYDGDTELWFLTPYSQYAPAPVAYRYLPSENAMKLVFQDGTLLE